jgi:hypothetical protein
LKGGHPLRLQRPFHVQNGSCLYPPPTPANRICNCQNRLPRLPRLSSNRFCVCPFTGSSQLLSLKRFPWGTPSTHRAPTIPQPYCPVRSALGSPRGPLWPKRAAAGTSSPHSACRALSLAASLYLIRMGVLMEFEKCGLLAPSPSRPLAPAPSSCPFCIFCRAKSPGQLLNLYGTTHTPRQRSVCSTVALTRQRHKPHCRVIL